MYDLGIITLIAIAALVMLIRGDPKWTLPALIGAVALFLVPVVTMLTIAYFTPKGSPLPPLFEIRQGEFFPYFYPAGSLQEALERNYRAIHETYEGLKTAQQVSAAAVFTVAYTETLLHIISTVAGGAPGVVVQLSKYAAYFSKVGDPVLQISLTTYNAVTAFVMVFHFLEFMAGAAVKMAVSLLALSLLAVIFGPTRALGGALLFFALIMIVPSYIGFYLAPVGKEFAAWGVETAKWLNATAANATGIAPVPLWAVEGAPHTLFLARYNNTFVLKSPAEISAEINKTLGLFNLTVSKDVAASVLEVAKRYKVFDKAAFNGTDWVTATAGSVTPIAYGNKTWLSTAINTWLDFPAPRPEEGGCVLHGDFREFIDYVMPPEEAQRLRERVANLSNAICQLHQWLGYRSYHLRVDVPAHWRFLTVAVNYTAKDRHGVVDRGVVYGWNGVWGWLARLDNETCFNALGNKTTCAVLDTTIRRGVYNFSLWTGEKRVVDPVAGVVRSEFSFAVRNASQPVSNRSVKLYRWVETCVWCCEYVNDTCVQWCSSSRDVWQRATVTKRLGSGRYQYNTTVYARPWVPEGRQNYTGQIPVTTRTWDVQIRLEYGEWRGDGTPPSDASCYTHSNKTYMVLSFFRAVPGPPRVLYAFAWMYDVGVAYTRQGGSLPDTLANYTDTDGVRVVEYLEGVEHQYYCQPALVPTAAPRWRPAVDAERNLTKLLRDNYLTLVVIRNVSLAYFARVGPYLEAAEASNSSLAKAAAASVREYLALINQTPAAVPLFYTSPSSYRGLNVIIACVMYDWRAPVNLTAALHLYPAREWWAAAYPMGDSRVARHVAEAKADMFRYVFGMPPPPPPVNLSGFVKQWRIPWNNRTLPYTPYYHPDMKMPPTDNETGIPLWNIQNLEDVQMTQSNVLSWLFTVLFATILSIVAVFEFLGALFDFPTPMRAVFGFVIGVIQDWTYWLPFRVAVRGRLLLRIWLAVKRPVMRSTVRTAARVHSFFATRIPGLRYLRSPDLKEYYREYVKRRRDIAIKDPAEQIREEIRVKWRREALERVLRAAEERADVEWLKNLQRRAEEERRARIEAARRIWNALRADNIIEAAREMSPRFDMWVQEKVEMSRGSLSYHLFWWRLDRLPYMWRVLLNLDPHVVARLAAEGKIKPEDAALYLNLRAAVEGYMRELRRSWGWLHPLSLYVEQAREEFEKARQRMIHEAEKGLADFRRFITEFQRHFEVLRRYFEDLSKLDEKERRQLEEAAKGVTERLNEAIRHFAVIDKAPRARLVSALNEALQRLAEGKAPLIPRDASVEGVVKNLALMDLETAVKVLRSAEKYLEAHYAVAPTRYDTRQIAAEVVKWKIEEQLPTLKLAGAARGIVLGGRSAEEGEALLKAWVPRDVYGERWAIVGGRFAIVDVYVERPWEAVTYRFSHLRERPLEVREAVRIKSDVVLTAEYAKYLAGFRAEEKALEILRKAVEYSRIERMLERAEELRLTPQAVERLTADAERLRREVLQETAEIFRKFREEFFFVKDLLEGRRVIRREVAEVREVVRAFEDAVAEALKAPQRRERVFREVFMERVERLVEEYVRRGDVEGAERIRRAAGELAKISETVGWSAVERLRPLLSPEHAGGVLGRLEFLHSLFTTEALETYRGLVYLRQVEELAREVRGLASVPGEAAEAVPTAERHRQLHKLVDELRETLKKAPEDVRAVFDEAFKALERRDFERASKELDKILKIIEEKKARLEPLERGIKEAKAVAQQLGLVEVVKALEKPAEKNVSKALGELERELARIYGALELVEYVKRPRADADFGHAWAVARVLGLEEADRLFKALSEASLYLLREGREVFRNPLYDEVKYLVDQEWVRSLVKAPMYSYVVDRLGPDVLQPTYARWYGLFVEYGPYLNTAFVHAKTSAVKAGAPLGLTGGFSYAGKMMKWLGDFSQEAVMRGLKAYYKGEGRPFRELSELTVRGAKIQLFDKAASLLTAKAAQMLSEAKTTTGEAAGRLEAEAYELKLLASVLRAKAAYEEVRLVQTYLKGAERRAEALIREAEALLKEGTLGSVEAGLALERRAKEMQEAAQRKAEKHLADARARYKAYLAEIKDFVGGHDVREVGMKYFGLTARAFSGDPEAVAERMIRAVDVRRVISWVDELKLPRELGEIAVRIADAERIYAKFEKILRAKAEPIPPVYDLEKTQHFFTEGAKPHPPPPRSRLEEAVPKVVKDVLTAYYSKLKDAAEKAAVYLALVKGDTRHASKEVKKAYQALQKALKAKDKEEALKALEELKAALKALGIEAEGGDVKAVLKAVEEKTRPFYEEYLNARREYVSAVEAIAKFSPEAALALGEAAREGGLDSIGRWMSLVAYEAGRRALEEYARFWARPLEERWDALPQAVREAVARREEETVYEVVRNTLRNVGIGVRRGVEMDLEGFEKALERVFTANGEWPEMREYVKQVVEAARRVQRGEASTEELEKAVDGLLAAYGAKAAERFVRSDRLEDAVAEVHEGMRHFARDTGLRIGREAAERALLLGLSTMPEELVETYARGGWRGRLEPYVAYWTEDAELARRAGEAGWEVRQIKRPVSFEEGVPKEWRTAYVVAPFGFDLAAVERAVVEYVDGAREGVARVRPVEWPVPEAFLWFVLKDREPVREGEWIVAYSIDRLSIEEPLAKFREALRGRNFDEARKVVHELYEARLNRTLWQIVYEFDRERAEAALEYLRQRYGLPESRIWERHDELYLTWLAFRLADEFEAYLKSGAGRGFRAKEEFGDLLALGRWLPVDLVPLFWLRLVGDPEGEAVFRNAWVTAVNMWFERMAAPYTPKKPAVARKAVELFNVFVGAGFKYEELFPQPPKPAEAAKPAEVKREAVKPETAKPEAVKPAEAAQKPAVEVQRPEERGLRRGEKPTVKPEAAKPEAVKPEVGPQAAKPEPPRPEPAAAAVEVRGLRRGGKPRAPVVDVMRVESVDYLLERFGVVLDIEAAFKAKSLVTAKVKARLEKVAAKEPEFAHVLAEVAERVLSSFGRLMASPDAARHVYNVLFYLFEGYETRDGELLFKMIEHTVKEAVKKAEEAGIPNAEYRIKQFILEVIDVLGRAGERYRRDALKGVSTVEKALRATALAGLSAAALYSVYSGLYSEAVVSSVASAVALAEVGWFKEAVEYSQKAAKALYETARDVFEQVKITVQRLVELFVEAVTRVLAWVDEHKAYLFLRAAVAAGVIALSVALNMWGLIELEKLAYAASLTPFVAAGVREHPREEAFKVLREAPDPYERFKEIAKAAIAKNEKLPQPWESLRVLIMPKPSEERRLIHSKTYRELDERKKKGLFYAVLALEEAFAVYRSALRKYAETVQRVDVGEEPFKKVMYMLDVGRLTQLAGEEGKAFENALKILRKGLNEYAVRYGLGDLLNVEEGVARELAEAKQPELTEFGGVSFGVKALAALMAYREYALGRGGAFGIAAGYWLEVGGSAWLLYYTPYTAHREAEKTKVERPAAVEEMVAEAFRRLFLKPGADHYSRLVEELTKGGKLALMFERETKTSYVFRLYRLEEGGGLKELGVKLWIAKVGEGEGASITYTLVFKVKRWLGFFEQKLKAAVRAAEEVGGRLPVEDLLPYMLGWVDSDVAIVRNRKGERVLRMTTSYLWQLAETQALFDWSVGGLRMTLTLEGPKLQIVVEAPLEKLDEAIKKSAKGEWLKMLGTKAGLEDLMDVKSWDDLKRWVVGKWSIVLDAAAKRLGEEVRSELVALRVRLNDDKIARKVVAPALLLIQAEKLGVDEATLKYFAAVVSGAIDGDGHVSAAMRMIGLTSGEREVALLWAAALAAYGIKSEVKRIGRDASQVVTSGGDAARLAGMYFLYGASLLEGDDRLKSHKLAEAVRLGAEGLDIRWEGLRRTKKGHVAADLTISEADVAVKYTVYLRKYILLEFQSTDRGRVELAARLLRLAGISAEVKRKEDGRGEWRVEATTDMLAAGREELRKALAEIVKTARDNGWVDEKKARRWLEKLEGGVAAWEGKKFSMRVVEGALEVRFNPTSRESVEEVAGEFKAMGLVEGVHFTVRWGGGRGHVYLLAEGVRRLKWVSIHGEEGQRRRAAEFLKFLEEKARAKGGEVLRKLEALLEEGRSRGALRLVGLEKDGVRVLDVKTEEKDDKLYVTLRAEVDGAAGEYKITFTRERDGTRRLQFYVRGEEAVARAVKLIEVLTGERPSVTEMPDGRTRLRGSERHIDALARYEELRETIERWSNQ
jgi:hypothetical protein